MITQDNITTIRRALSHYREILLAVNGSKQFPATSAQVKAFEELDEAIHVIWNVDEALSEATGPISIALTKRPTTQQLISES